MQTSETASKNGVSMKSRKYSRRLMALIGTLAMVVITGVISAAPAQAAVVGVCTIKANDPHPSTHVQGSINATGTIQCTVAMSELYIRVWLESPSGQLIAGTPDDRFGVSYVQGNSAISCSNAGTWRTRVGYVLHSPPGLNPAYASGNVVSPWKSVACGVALLAAITGTNPGSTGVTQQTVEIGAATPTP